MKNTVLINGFTDIKLQLIEKCRIKKSAHEIILWFSERNNETYVHDSNNHSANFIIALKVENGWRYYLDVGSLGEMTLIHYVGRLNTKNASLARELNDGYKMLGYITPRSR